MTKTDRIAAASRLAKKWGTWMLLDDGALLVEVQKLFPAFVRPQGMSASSSSRWITFIQPSK